jgi:hypothetical protein
MHYNLAGINHPIIEEVRMIATGGRGLKTGIPATAGYDRVLAISQTGLFRRQ